MFIFSEDIFVPHDMRLMKPLFFGQELVRGVKKNDFRISVALGTTVLFFGLVNSLISVKQSNYKDM